MTKNSARQSLRVDSLKPKLRRYNTFLNSAENVTLVNGNMEKPQGGKIGGDWNKVVTSNEPVKGKTVDRVIKEI